MLALTGVTQFTQFFFLKFSTDVLLLAPATVGAVYTASRFWDALVDPLIGFWSDRTRTRLGRRRPWMLGSLPFMALTFAMIWFVPVDLTSGAKLVWLTVAILAFYSAQSAYWVPYVALGTELSRDHHDRSRIFGSWFAAGTAGTLVAFAGMQYVIVAEDAHAAVGRLAVGLALVLVAFMLIPAIGLRERAEHQGRGPESPLPALRDVFANPHARRLLSVGFVQSIPLGGLGMVVPFYMQYVIGRPEAIIVVMPVFVILGIVSIPLWVRISQSRGKRATWIGALLMCGLAFSSMSLIGAGEVLLLAIALGFAGAGMGCCGMMGVSVLADVVDSDEERSGERKEGAYSSAWGLATKFGVAIVAMPVGLALQLSGFTPNVDQPESVLLTIRALFGGLPLTAFFASAAILIGFKLDEAEHARILTELEARRS